MIPKTIKEHFSEIRKCKKCTEEETHIDLPQPGLFLGRKYLFIGQNPGYPNVQKMKLNEILLDKNTDDEKFHDTYKQIQLNWKFYNGFIKHIIRDSMDFSIINICRCPTKMNACPSCEMIENCNKYLLKSIELINPKYIICVGHIAQIEIKTLELDKKYKCVYSNHYAYLMRQPRNYVKNYLNEIKKQLQ